MRYGVCLSDFGKADFLFDLGYNYLEFNLASVVSLSESEFNKLVGKSKESPLKAEAFNCFISKKIVGENIEWPKLTEYVKVAINRAKLLGGEIIVFGSGNARNIPDDFPRETAIRQLIDFLNMAGEEAGRNGIYIVLENLNKKESNILNTVEEGLDLLNKINSSNIKLLADFYHMKMEREKFEILNKAGKNLYHVHLANSNGRIYPKYTEEDSYDLFFNELKRINYNKRISIEAGLKNQEDYANAIKVLRYYAE